MNSNFGFGWILLIAAILGVQCSQISNIKHRLDKIAPQEQEQNTEQTHEQ